MGFWKYFKVKTEAAIQSEACILTPINPQKATSSDGSCHAKQALAEVGGDRGRQSILCLIGRVGVGVQWG